METTFTANAAPSSSEACNERDEQFPAGSHGYEEPALRPQTEKDGLLGRVSHWKWKQVFTVITLWLGYLSVGTAYSTIAPFFPNEVGECKYSKTELFLPVDLSGKLRLKASRF